MTDHHLEEMDDELIPPMSSTLLSWIIQSISYVISKDVDELKRYGQCIVYVLDV